MSERQLTQESYVYKSFSGIENKPGYYVDHFAVKFFNNKWMINLHFQDKNSIIVTLLTLTREDVEVEEFSLELMNYKLEYKGPMIFTPHNKFGFLFENVPDCKDVKINLKGMKRKIFNYSDYDKDIHKPSPNDGTITLLNDNKVEKIIDNFISYGKSINWEEIKRKKELKRKKGRWDLLAEVYEVVKTLKKLKKMPNPLP